VLLTVGGAVGRSKEVVKLAFFGENWRMLEGLKIKRVYRSRDFFKNSLTLNYHVLKLRFI